MSFFNNHLIQVDAQYYREWQLKNTHYDFYYPFTNHLAHYLTGDFSHDCIINNTGVSLNILSFKDFVLKHQDDELFGDIVFIILKSCFIAYYNNDAIIKTDRFRTLLEIVIELYDYFFTHDFDIDERDYLRCFQLSSIDDINQARKKTREISLYLNASQLRNLLPPLVSCFPFIKEVSYEELKNIVTTNRIEILMPVISCAMGYKIGDYANITNGISKSKATQYFFKFNDISIEIDTECFSFGNSNGLSYISDVKSFVHVGDCSFSLNWNLLRDLVIAIGFFHDGNYMSTYGLSRGENIKIIYSEHPDGICYFSISSFNIAFTRKHLHEFILKLNLFFESDDMVRVFSRLNYYLGNL